MPSYSYKAFDSKGSIQSGYINAESERLARKEIKSLNLIPHKLKKIKSQTTKRYKIKNRDLVLASEKPQGHGYNPSGFTPSDARHVDFLTSYPPGDIYNNQLWGPMREETNSWFQRLYVGTETPHASAEDGHKNLVMTMAMDASSKINDKIEISDNIEAEILKIQGQ